MQVLPTHTEVAHDLEGFQYYVVRGLANLDTVGSERWFLGGRAPGDGEGSQPEAGEAEGQGSDSSLEWVNTLKTSSITS